MCWFPYLPTRRQSNGHQPTSQPAMSTQFMNAPRDGLLDASPMILDLAKEVLPATRLAWAEHIAVEIVSTKSRKWKALRELADFVPVQPKRPLRYLREIEIGRLPHTTRNVVRYSGDYVDMLTKEMAYDVLGSSGARRKSLGANSKELFQKGPEEHRPLFAQMGKLDYFLNNPGKHDMSDPPGRDHRFTAREAVLCVCVALELGNRIKPLSARAGYAAEFGAEYSMGSQGRFWEGAEYTGSDAPRPPGDGST